MLFYIRTSSAFFNTDLATNRRSLQALKMTIEGNKDEAEKCITVARNYIKFGNMEKAEKFLLKAERLYPTPKSKELLARVRSAGPSTSSPQSATPESSTEDVRKRKTPTHTTPQREYSQDQVDAVRRINTKCKDYYEILGKINYYAFTRLTCYYVQGRFLIVYLCRHYCSDVSL